VPNKLGDLKGRTRSASSAWSSGSPTDLCRQSWPQSSTAKVKTRDRLDEGQEQ